MANYYRCDLEAVKACNQGGRLHSAVNTAEMPNGVFCNLGAFVEGSTEVRTMVAPDATADTRVGIVMKPEINYDERYKTDYAIGIFRNPADKPVPVVMLEELDGLALSEDYFTKTGDIAVGDMFAIAKNLTAGSQLTYSATAPTGNFYVKVVGIKYSHVATYVHSDGARFPKPYKMIQLEVIFK